MATCLRTDKQTHARTHVRAHACTHTHTIKPPTAGVQLVGHTSIKIYDIIVTDGNLQGDGGTQNDQDLKEALQKYNNRKRQIVRQ